MEIKAISKLKNQYEILIDDTKMSLDISMIYKYRIKVGMQIDKKTYKELTKAQQFFDLDQLALKKLKKMHTVHEIRQLLLEQGASESMSKQLIDKYIKHKYLDDLNYAKTYITIKQSTQGPY